MVSSLSPCSTPSQVWMVLLDLTGMVPSPDSILVLNCPRAFLLGCLSPWSKTDGRRRKIGKQDSDEEKSSGNHRQLKTTQEHLNLHANVFNATKQWKKRKQKNDFHKSVTHYLLLRYQSFLTGRAPSIQWLIERGYFLFSPAVCNGKHSDRSKREVNQTDSAGEQGGREADRDGRQMTKSSNYLRLV